MALFGLIGAMVEGGLMMMRAALLERGLEQTVRDLRLGEDLSDEMLRGRLCAAALMDDGCGRRLVLMRAPFEVETLEGAAMHHHCREDAPAMPVEPGAITVISACLLVDPILPVAAMAAGFAPQPDGRVAIVARGAYAAEAVR